PIIVQILARYPVDSFQEIAYRIRFLRHGKRKSRIPRTETRLLDHIASFLSALLGRINRLLGLCLRLDRLELAAQTLPGHAERVSRQGAQRRSQLGCRLASLLIARRRLREPLRVQRVEPFLLVHAHDRLRRRVLRQRTAGAFLRDVDRQDTTLRHRRLVRDLARLLRRIDRARRHRDETLVRRKRLTRMRELTCHKGHLCSNSCPAGPDPCHDSPAGSMHSAYHAGPSLESIVPAGQLSDRCDANSTTGAPHSGSPRPISSIETVRLSPPSIPLTSWIAET